METDQEKITIVLHFEVGTWMYVRSLHIANETSTVDDRERARASFHRNIKAQFHRVDFAASRLDKSKLKHGSTIFRPEVCHERAVGALNQLWQAAHLISCWKIEHTTITEPELPLLCWGYVPMKLLRFIWIRWAVKEGLFILPFSECTRSNQYLITGSE